MRFAASIEGALTYGATTGAKAAKETWVDADDTNGTAEMLAIVGSIPRHRDDCPTIPIEWERLHQMVARQQEIRGTREQKIIMK